jgi:hypothetical protein
MLRHWLLKFVHCNRPLMKIDHYGEVLVGCVDCNRWGHPGDDKLVMEPLPDDLEALSVRNQGAKEPVVSRYAEPVSSLPANCRFPCIA